VREARAGRSGRYLKSTFLSGDRKVGLSFTGSRQETGVSNGKPGSCCNVEHLAFLKRHERGGIEFDLSVVKPQRFFSLPMIKGNQIETKRLL
jgi:hypothetical protein